MVWTTEEIQSYRQIESKELDGIYAKVNIPSSNPEERARYLAEEVLDLKMIDHEIIMKTAAEDGRPESLNMLERWAISRVEV